MKRRIFLSIALVALIVFTTVMPASAQQEKQPTRAKRGLSASSFFQDLSFWMLTAQWSYGVI